MNEEGNIENPVFDGIIQPDPVPFTFEAPGWQVLFGVLLTILIAVVIYQFIQYQKNKYRRDAIKEVDRIIKSYSNDYFQQVYACQMLLKRISLRFENRESSASLVDADWIQFLNQHCAGARFDDSDASLISNLVYADDQPDIAELQVHLSKVKLWIKKHKVK